MGRILAIDYGQRRVGLAVTDPLQIIATALTTVDARDALSYIVEYCTLNSVERIVIGMPIQMNGTPSESQRYILPFIERMQTAMPQMPIDYADERYTSKMAMQTMIDVGIKKMARREKGTIDRISAALILQSYLETKTNNKI